MIYNTVFGLNIYRYSVKTGEGNTLLVVLVLAFIFLVNAGYGGGFSNVPTLLSDHYGMSSISAIHGITLSAWAFAGLTGNVIKVNPTGYQNVLYFTVILYIVAFILCMVFVKPTNKDK